MSLLPLPSRLPARKHLLAAGFGLLGLSLMAAAVMTASGLTLPFTSGDPERVRAGSIVVDAPTTTTEAPPATSSTTRRAGVSPALDPVAVPGPTGSSPPTTAARPAPTTTTTTLPVTPPTLLPPIGGLGLDRR
jgi:hypothetical protein